VSRLGYGVALEPLPTPTKGVVSWGLGRAMERAHVEDVDGKISRHWKHACST